MQVITPENHVEFITTGKVAEFKPPVAGEAAKPEVKPDVKTASTTGAAPDAKADGSDKSKDEPKRDADGKFIKAGDTPADVAKVDADDDVKLTERITRLINKKHREMKEAQEFATGEGRRAIEAERRAEQLQREIDALKGKKADGPATGGEDGEDPNEPKMSAFKTVGDYARALIEYKAEKAAKTGEAKADQTKQQEHANQVVGEFVKRQDDFRKATPDYDDVIGDTDLVLHNVGMQYLIESDVGPQLGYHLAKNPDEVTRLNKLSPTRLLAELGKLETKLEKPAAPKTADAGATKEVSKAPAPISPLDGSNAAAVHKDPKDMTFQELRAFRQQEARAKAAR
jgi:hypothetical protein